MTARAIWKGELKIGPTRIPVNLYSAVKDRSVHFHILEERTMSRVKQHMVNPDNGEEVPADEIQKGYEVEPGTKVPRASARRFERLISKKSETRPSRKETKDNETERLLKVVKRKRSRRKDVVKAEPPKGDAGNVVDIMEVLKKSMAQKR